MATQGLLLTYIKNNMIITALLLKRMGYIYRQRFAGYIYRQICNISRDFSYFLFVRSQGPIATSGCRSSSKSFTNTVFELAMVENPDLKFRCRLPQFHYRNISISGFGGHIAISGCPWLSQSFCDTFFELAVVENVISNSNSNKTCRLYHLNYNDTYFDPFHHVSQHERKIFPVSNNKLSYRKQIAPQLRTQYVESIYSNSMTLKSRLGITQCHWKRHHSIDRIRVPINIPQ